MKYAITIVGRQQLLITLKKYHEKAWPFHGSWHHLAWEADIKNIIVWCPTSWDNKLRVIDFEYFGCFWSNLQNIDLLCDKEMHFQFSFISLLLFPTNHESVLTVKSIGGFHVMQGSLIITQDNYHAYHLINWVKKLKYHRGVTNKQRVKVSGMCNIPNSSYSAKGITENYSV